MTPMFSITGGQPAIRDISMTWRAFMGIPEGSGPIYRTLEDYARTPADEAWVFACVRRRYTAAMSVPLRVWVKDGKQRIAAEDAGDADATELQRLLDDVNPVDMNSGDLKAWLEAGLAVWGEGYIQQVRGRLGGRTQELYWLRAPDITPKPTRNGIESYEYRPSVDGLGPQEARSIPARDMLAWRTVNLQNRYRGLSPLAAVRNEMRVDMGASAHTASTLENWGVPVGAWVAPKDADISPQDVSLIRRALRSLRGPRNQGKTPVLPQGLEWKNLSLNPKDAEWLAARKVSRMTICAALGVPLVLAGDDEKTTVYANLRDAERIFWRNTMITELDWIADGFNSQLVPQFDKTRERLVIGFDYSQIESLQDPVTTRKSVALKELEGRVRTRNEYRAEFRMGEPLPDGDVIEAAPAPADTEMGDTPPSPNPADVIRSLGRRLYREPAVRAYLATGDPVVLEALFAPDDIEHIAVGLKRGYKASQLLDGVPAEGYAGIAEAPQPVPTQPVLIDPAAAQYIRDGLTEVVIASKDDAARSTAEFAETLTAIREQMRRQSAEHRLALKLAEDRMRELMRPKPMARTVERDEHGLIVAVVDTVDGVRTRRSVERDADGRFVSLEQRTDAVA